MAKLRAAITTNHKPLSTSKFVVSELYTAFTLSNPHHYYPPPTLEVSHHIDSASHEVHDRHDPSTFTTFAPRHPPPGLLSRPSPLIDNRPPSASNPRHSLRRVRRSPDVRQLPHRRTVSHDIRSTRDSQAQAQGSTPIAVNPDSEVPFAQVPPALSEPQTDAQGSTIDDPYQLLTSSYWPRRTVGVSSRTASAILFALEEGIRRPIPFTTDWEEVNASMSDMVGVAGSAAPMGNTRIANGGPRAPPVGSASAQAPPTQPPSGMRTPTDIMRQRRDREARRKAEQEAREKEQEELERQQMEHEQQLQQHQQKLAQAEQYAAQAPAPAPAPVDPASQRRGQARQAQRGPPPQQASDNVPLSASGPAQGHRPTTSAGPMASRQEYSTSAAPLGPSAPGSDMPANPPRQGPGIQHGRSQSAAAATGPQPGATGFAKSGPAPGAPSQDGASQTLQQPRRAGFPHAFERWETLSSHWEGLTSYWIRKLEQQNEDLERDPLNQQLARQITDLSAAGANLFHAVVELQRLRASSERKFQRWFFDTRAEQERSKEIQAELERQLKAERQGREDAFAAAQTAEQDKAKAEELLREMRRELQISKEEARRAWEELGRREQEERDRTNSLRNGEPTLVGGVQVVPMVQGVPSRHPSRPPTTDGAYTSGPPTASMATDNRGKTTDPSMGLTYYDENTPVSPTGSDPFVEPRKTDPPVSKAQYPTHNQVYAQEPATTPYVTPATEPDTHSYIGSSDAEEEYPEYARGISQQYHPYPAGPRSEESDEYEHGAVEDRPYTSDGSYTASTSAPVHAPYPPTSADYSGTGWGVGTGWESVTPRHRHPTRLSDVLEEDEPSRTSPSRASQASRSMH
ncbi:Uncharacterized protein PECH_003939 [Penicillium ucsense]|uniref:Uncharacterized protein n=1 Tax=Penicillium ucsense TaxID=2839758 RepID=A0A8J8WKP9_9EURO|nr:Uncharacterized protein PECM_004923 [Penicillium ucsense]KAF7728977.1 Uncharacterized protein PECH_003939 [Penicillium ucsense]